MKTAKQLSVEMGKIIVYARTVSNVTQKQLEKKSGVTQESISRAETKGCSVALAEKLLNSMGCTLEFHHISWSTKEKDGSTTQYQSFLGQ